LTDDEIMDALGHWARNRGCVRRAQGASALAAYRKLRGQQVFSADDSVVLFNTGSGLKYLDVN